MSTLRYGFFGEDDAQRLFLHHYLTAMSAKQPWQFQIDEKFGYRFKGLNKKQVYNLFDEVCQIGSRDYQQNCFFVGLDLDDYSVEAFHTRQREMQGRLQAREVEAILLIPVQCIEHWLWYLKWRIENPRSTKNENFEMKPRSDAKLAVYNAKKCSTKHSNPIAEQLASGIDIEWLASHSTSFLAFHQQVEAYLAALTTA